MVGKIASPGEVEAQVPLGRQFYLPFYLPRGGNFTYHSTSPGEAILPTILPPPGRQFYLPFYLPWGGGGGGQGIEPVLLPPLGRQFYLPFYLPRGGNFTYHSTSPGEGILPTIQPPLGGRGGGRGGGAGN